MNYLAHLFLADQVGASLVGNLLGDFKKGRIDDEYPEEVNRGIRMHRALDAFTDRHPAWRESRSCIRPDRRRVAGIVVDLVYDHVLARRWDRFSKESLDRFTQRVAQSLKAAAYPLPPRMTFLIDVMREEDLLGSYREVEGIAQAVDRIGYRFSRPDWLRDALEDLLAAYDKVETHFFRFLPDAREAARACAAKHPV